MKRCTVVHIVVQTIKINMYHFQDYYTLFGIQILINELTTYTSMVNFGICPKIYFSGANIGTKFLKFNSQAKDQNHVVNLQKQAQIFYRHFDIQITTLQITNPSLWETNSTLVFSYKNPVLKCNEILWSPFFRLHHSQVWFCKLHRTWKKSMNHEANNKTVNIKMLASYFWFKVRSFQSTIYSFLIVSRFLVLFTIYGW